MKTKDKKRCAWVGADNELYNEYHDTEWGVPVYDDQTLFEFLTLEGAQAGLSWLTILKKREGYRKAFKNFDPKKVAKLTQSDIVKLLQNESIIRNRLKIESTITNAQHFLDIQKEFGSFSTYQWQFVDGKPLQNKFKQINDVPTVTDEAKIFSKDLKKRGFKFVGPTIIYAYMQAVGMVNDHTLDCFRYREVRKLAK